MSYEEEDTCHMRRRIHVMTEVGRCTCAIRRGKTCMRPSILEVPTWGEILKSEFPITYA